MRSSLRFCLSNQRRYAASLVEAFQKISSNRVTHLNFADTKVSPIILRRVLELTQHAPTSFNLQPYKIIVVDDKIAKEGLATAMLGGNGRKVLNASATVVFLADKNPTRNTRRLMNLELAHGADPGYVNSLPAKISLLLGGGLLSNTVRRLATHLLSPIVAAPSISSTEVWSVKNTALVAQQFMLAATAYGLATAPMEGFDERRLCYQLKIPTCDYCVPMVVCVGYSIKEDSAQISKESENRCAMQKVRFPLEDVAYSNSFGKKLELN